MSAAAPDLRVHTPLRGADDPDRRLISRTWRRIAVQTAVVFTVGIVALGAVAAALILQVQHAETTRLLSQAVTSGDDEIPPPGTWVYRWRPAADQDGGAPGEMRTSPGAPSAPADPAALRAVVAGGPDRTTEVRQGDRELLVRTQRRGGRTVQAALDLSYQEHERHRLYLALAVAGGLGMVLSVLVGGVIARRAITPLGLALARQRRFVADASHELRTPLTQLHTRAQLLEREVRAGAEPGRLSRDSQQLVRGTRELGELVEELLLAAQQRAEPAQSQPVDMAALAGDVVAAETARAAELGIELVVATDGGAAPAGYVVPGSRPALRRVLTSLVDNALGHTPAGGHVQVRLARPAGAGQVEVRVTDDGVGFDPADAQRLFERFARGGHGDRRRFGLGLALVREVVEAHRGSVTAAGEPGRGATFTVRLPAGHG